MRLQTRILLLLWTLCLIGCGPHETPRRQVTPPPARRDIPLDSSLISAANRELGTALQSSDLIVRSHALEAIGTVGSKLHNDAVIQRLSDSDSRVRFAAAIVAGELKLTTAHAPLLAKALDPSMNVRVAVRFALHRIGDTSLSHDLEDLARYVPDARVRANTAYVLGLLGDHSALPLLRLLRTDKEPPVRQNAAEAMWRLGDEEGLEDLIALTMSRYPDDRAIGLLALAEPRNTKARQSVRNGLISEESWPEVPLVAARGMGMLGSDEGYAIAASGAASSDPRQRQLAAFALGAIGRTDAQSMLRKLLEDSDAEVRIAAATAILQLKP